MGNDSMGRDYWTEAISNVFEWEGGYVWHRLDPGGETKFGISKRSHPRLNIRELTKESAARIYRTEYWNPLRLGELCSPVSIQLLELAVLCGPLTATRLVQKALEGRVIVDGRIGPHTLNIIRLSNGIYLSTKLLSQAEIYFQEIIAKNHDLKTFEKGWLRRVRATWKLVTGLLSAEGQNVPITETPVSGLQEG